MRKHGPKGLKRKRGRDKMTNTEEITKLKKRVMALEKETPVWLESLAKDYIIPGIKAAVAEHVDKIKRDAARKTKIAIAQQLIKEITRVARVYE